MSRAHIKFLQDDEPILDPWSFWAQGYCAGDAEGSARERQWAANARTAAA